MAFTTLELPAAVRGYHVYRASWQPRENDVLQCYHERGNSWDSFAIKTCKRNSEIAVGHLPMELSKLSKFLIDRGALVEAELSSTNYRRSPLVQGGLEIPCIIRIKMLSTRKNKELLARYKKIYDENYSKAEELVMGSFLAPVLTSSSTLSSSKRTSPASKIYTDKGEES